MNTVIGLPEIGGVFLAQLALVLVGVVWLVWADHRKVGWLLVIGLLALAVGVGAEEINQPYYWPCEPWWAYIFDPWCW